VEWELKVLCTTVVLCFAIATLAQTSSTQPHNRRRIFWPELANASSTAPLKPQQKFKFAVANTLNPVSILGAAVSGALSQALDTNTGFGQGWDGYGKRVGAAYAGTASNQFFGTFVFPTLLHQDPRYFRKGSGSAGSRIKYALTRSFVTRTDSGGTAPNYSFWLGQGSSAAISNLYYGPGDRSATDALVRFLTGSATSTGFNVVKEFLPEIIHKVHKKRADH